MLLLCNFFLANAVYIFWTVKSALLAKYFQFSWYPSFIIDYLLLSYWHTHIECSVHGSKYHLLVKQCIIFSFVTTQFQTYLLSSFVFPFFPLILRTTRLLYFRWFTSYSVILINSLWFLQIFSGINAYLLILKIQKKHWAYLYLAAKLFIKLLSFSMEGCTYLHQKLLALFRKYYILTA